MIRSLRLSSYLIFCWYIPVIYSLQCPPPPLTLLAVRCSLRHEVSRGLMYGRDLLLPPAHSVPGLTHCDVSYPCGEPCQGFLYIGT